MFKLVGICLALVLYMQTAEGLECWRCQNYATDSDSDLLRDLKSKSDPLCDNFSPTEGSETCPTDGGTYKCGMVKGSATFGLPLIAEVTVSTTVRGCMPVVQGTPNGCVDNDSQANKLVKNALNAAISEAFGVTLDGNVCYCDTDFCSACDKDTYGIAGFCLPIWGWALIAVGGVLSLFLLTCCCCCCRCCRNKNAPRYTHTMIPVAVAVQQPNGSIGIANPGYGQQTMVANNGQQPLVINNGY